MFKVNGVEYSLKYNIRSVKMIENAIGKSVVALFYTRENAMVTLDELTTLIAYGLCDSNGKWIPYERAYKIAEEYIIQDYAPAYETMFKRLQKDCGFLFR